MPYCFVLFFLNEEYCPLQKKNFLHYNIHNVP